MVLENKKNKKHKKLLLIIMGDESVNQNNKIWYKLGLPSLEKVKEWEVNREDGWLWLAADLRLTWQNFQHE